MIIYTANAAREFVVQPGERVMYGQDEQNLMGWGLVCLNPEGELVVNGTRVDRVLREFNFVRKA
jgi:hypothetical protein